ncbi:helix-turn-helix transcriptional regulator [Mucilaginibacter sp. SP1R1]|uniref:helix-turn-helix transcriptional regulator n=1 Tax=Mucilaginibacter sp. SP1R1 TaxID=2723091 RepID=UPI001616DE41|nr:tetratricopeptide repeat protein [Mucilaginibacter sp. SP1R1]MBB6150163.1 tetratricopeptide (TPR) repeat protein [Mucilaginibacter sp. SP1R1]
MKLFFAGLIAAALAFCGSNSYAQYRVKQIDSIYAIIDQSHDTKRCLTLGNIIYNASKAIGYEQGMLKAKVICGVKCYDASRWEDAFRYSTEGEELAAKLHDTTSLTLLSIIKGTSYTYLGFYKEGRQTLLNAIPLALHIPDADVRHFRIGNICFSLGLNNEMSGGNLRTTLMFRQKSYDEQLKISKKSKYVIRLSTAVVNMGDIYFKLKQYDSAAYYLNRAINLSAQHNIYNLHAKGMASTDLGELFYREHRYRESEIYYQKALVAYTELKNGYHIRDIYMGLSKVCIALKQNREAQKYLDMGMQLSDSIARVEKNAIKTPLGYIAKNDAQQLSENKRRIYWIILTTSIFFIITISAVCVYLHRLKKVQQEKAKEIDDLMKKLEHNGNFSPVFKSAELKEIVELAINNNPAFLMKYNEFDAEFSKKLFNIAPNLVASEIEFCVLLRLNFETKEIARYTRTSVRAVEGKKYRIRKKLGVPSNVDLNVMMTRI